MNTLKNAFESVKETLTKAVSTNETSDIVPLAEIIALEEKERTLRMDKESSLQEARAKQNAKLASALISSTSFPYFKGGLNKGFKLHTRKAEELERSRLLASKQELALKKNNAFLLSSGIKSLGWPFIRSEETEFFLTNEQSLIADEERERRIADKQWAMNARNNAALVSNLVRWDNYQRHTTAGAKRMTKNMEEKERKLRLQDKAEQERAADLAFQTSGLIRRLGWPFYAQPSYDNKDMTRSMEEEEKNLRLTNPHERMIAQEKAGMVADLIHAKDALYLAEKEKERRVEDSLEQERHQAHAKKIAGIIAKTYDPSELERKRLLGDKTRSREAQLGAKKVSEMVPHFMSVSSWSINRATEKERARKMNDITGTAFAKFNAKKIAGLVADADLEKKTAWTNELEQERVRRMHDRLASDLAKKNARKVSKMVLRNQQPAPLVQEATRSIPAGYPGLEQTAAPLPVQEATRSVPAGYPGLEQTAAPLPQPVQATRSVPEFEQQAPVFQQQAPMFQQQAPMFQQQAPVFQQQSPFLAQQAPFLNQQQSLVMSSGPVYVGSTTSPATLPVTYASPAALPMTYRSSPAVVAPVTYGTTTTYLPAANPAYVPVDAGVPSHLRVMTDKERKKLEKQATKHSRTSQREARKAEHDLSKAEKLHFKGKDSRALKYETKAEQHNVAAKHHQAWAQELAQDSLLHTLPSALPTVYRPAM